MSYVAPIKDMQFVLNELTELKTVQQLPGCEEATDDTVQAVLEEAARFLGEVVAPLNRVGDTQPARWKDGVVTTSPGFRDAFNAFVEAGWQGLQHPAEFGGQGMPKVVSAPFLEMLQAANLSFALCPLLTDGAIEALLVAGSDEQKTTYLPRLIDGRWTGTMNLTEAQAGSDLSQVRTRAVPQGDGTYRLTGEKIFITYGEHDLADNIVHLVLARTPDAPEGVKGISLFIVPKQVVGADGAAGPRNDVFCASIEHKLGIHGSPTCVLVYGSGHGEVGPGGAIGYLVGEENRGLEYMFVMMNAARFQVGMQGIAVSERAYQHAVAYARERVQSRAVEGSKGPVTIIHHPDVRRLLMTMRAHVEAARALAYVAAGYEDVAHHHPDEAVRRKYQAAYEYLVPLVKGWSTENSIDVASAGVQVHGGMGFVEETGAAQYYRDARILTIYEGTTAIQANDLVGRKTARDGGAVAQQFIAQMQATAAELAEYGDDYAAISARLFAAANACATVVKFVVDNYKADIRAVFAGSVPYLKLAGLTHGGWQLARAALAARRMLEEGRDTDFATAKIATARFFADHVLVTAPALAQSIVAGSAGTLALSEQQF